jgi:membrane protein YqaA with SNARE-associated domain
MDTWITSLLALLALPTLGLTSLFVVCFISATLLPLGSEPAVVGLLQLNPDLFWPAIFVATLGNTLGGALNWWLGTRAERVFERIKPQSHHARGLKWLQRFGPKACLLAWLPLVGDPLCAVAGWLKMPFWPCLVYMAIGKFLRYFVMTVFFLGLIPRLL